MMFSLSTVTLLVLSGFLPVVVESAASATLECGACMLLVNELEASIAEADPNKKMEMGSYRVGPDGQQKLSQVAYARSQSHIVELLENVCDKAKEYKLVMHPSTGKGVYVNKKSTYLRGDDSSSMQAKLHNSCNDFVDEHEEQLEKLLKKEQPEPVKSVCHKTLGVCTSVDVTQLPPNDPPAEQKDNGKDEEKEDEGDDDNEL